MINNIRIDYSGSHESIDMDKLAAFVSDVQEMLSDIDEEINQQEAILVIKVYDGKRLTHSFENISRDTARRINQLSRPF
jgi:ABC-type xylose transport system substrate-binding protein